MSKPIFIIRFPYSDNNMDRDIFKKNYEDISNKLNDYHVLAIMGDDVETVTFECFNAPHTEMEFEELKHRVLELLKYRV